MNKFENSIFFSLLLSALLSTGICVERALGAPQVRITESPVSRAIQQPTITKILKSREGILWVGTQHGLYRFDGAQLIEYSSHLTGENWIPASDIKGIIEDADGTLMVATFGGGLLVWDNLGESFSQLPSPTPKNNWYITELFVSSDNRIWVGDEHNLYLYKRRLKARDKPFSQYRPIDEKGDFSAISTDSLGNTYASFGTNIYSIPKNSDAISLIYSGSSHRQDHGKITAIAGGDHSNLYIGTAKGEIFSIRTKGETKIESAKIGVGTSNSIIALLFHRSILWIGTNRGLSYTDPLFSKIENFYHENSGLPNDHVLELVAENDFIWIGTYSGLATLKYVPFETFNTQNSSVHNDVLTFGEDRYGQLWVGTFNGLYAFNSERGNHRNYQHLIKNNNISDQRVMTLAPKGNEIWLGFQKSGVQVLDIESSNIGRPDIPMIESFEVTKILHSSSDDTWIATFNRGLYQYKSEGFRSFLDSGGLPEISITILFELENGQILASSEQQIYFYDDSKSHFFPLTLRIDHKHVSPLILSISQSYSGDIWIGTKDQGLFVVKKERGKLVASEDTGYDARQFIPNATIYAIQFDADGNAWCSTQSGIIKLTPEGETISQFKTADGLQGNDFNFGASLKDSTGRIYFGGSNGYNRFTPEETYKVKEPPRMMMTSIAISNSTVVQSYKALELQNIHLTHKDYLVQFEFSVLDFLDPPNNQYRYMLEGFDPAWIENGKRNSATYTSLPPGSYKLRVQGANSAEIWNREGLSLNVTVLPPPWKTWWAFTGYALFLVFLLWLGKRTYDSFVEKRMTRKLTLELNENAERAEDELQEQFEIHDDLVKSVYRHSVSTLELVSEFISTKGDSEAREATASSLKRVHALTLLEDCLHYQNEILLADLQKYTEKIVSLLLKDSTIGAEHVTTINDVTSRPLPIEQASALAIALFELIENAIQHAFERASGGNYLQITLAMEDSSHPEAHYYFAVQDNGVGIPTNIDTKSPQTPGLKIVASMAKRVSGVSTIKVKKGTRVSIIFPVNEHAL